jgi:hypothetical protein
MLKELAKRFKGKLSRCEVYDANVCATRTVADRPWELIAVTGQHKLQGGGISYVPSQGYDPQAFIDPTRTRGAVYDPDAIRQGLPQGNTAEEFGHEVLGHIWGELNGGHPAGTRANMRDSISGEDVVRKLDPTRGQKAIDSHHNYDQMPPDKKPN